MLGGHVKHNFLCTEDPNRTIPQAYLNVNKLIIELLNLTKLTYYTLFKMHRHQQFKRELSDIRTRNRHAPPQMTLPPQEKFSFPMQELSKSCGWVW